MRENKLLAHIILHTFFRIINKKRFIGNSSDLGIIDKNLKKLTVEQRKVYLAMSVIL
jgi:hypothetical protein